MTTPEPKNQCPNCNYYTLQKCRATAISASILLMFLCFTGGGIFLPLAIIFWPLGILLMIILLINACYTYRKDDVRCTNCKYTTAQTRNKK